MTTITTIFNGNLELPFTRTNSFRRGDYLMIIVPALAELNTELEVDVALQVDVGNIRRQVILPTAQVLDTTYITEIPFSLRNNDSDLFLFVFATNSYNAQIKVVINENKQLDRIEQKVDEVNAKVSIVQNTQAVDLFLQTSDVALQGIDVGVDLIPLLPAVPLLPLP